MPRRTGSSTFARRLGARIRTLRLEAKVTQEKLAWACDLDKGYLSQVEAGKRLPSLPVLSDLADELGLHVVDLLGFDLRDQRVRLLDATRRGDREEVHDSLKRLRLE